jgi:predicted 3-demethylubiquinone-9 3-methyltransferase (glyoxalase superfamily)
VVACKDQKEIDTYWAKILKAGGQEQACGWIKDRWGVHWQIVPADMDRYMESKDKAANERAFAAMIKLDVAAIKAAFKGR